MNGRLVVIEGLDGSGKATQSALLAEATKGRGLPVRQISFPDYKDESSALVRIYLNGGFGNKPEDVGAYAASSFYAVDRYASFKRYWGRDYRHGVMIIADRYTSSNAVHQMAKLPEGQWEEYLKWLYDYEYRKMEIPAPNQVIYLDMPPSLSAKLIDKRYQGNCRQKDLHEKDTAYLEKCRQAAVFAAKYSKWTVISCYKGETILNVEEIHREIVRNLQEP